jgi:hypothetical protein
VLSRAVAETVGTIAEAQLADGMIPWYPGGHADPWNHVEAAMALTLGGRWAEAERAYRWLADTQHGDGSWFTYYLHGAVEDRRLDTHVSAYVAVGAWHHYLATGDLGFLEAMFAVVEPAVGFVLGLQRPEGEVIWSVDAHGAPGRFALLTGSSSTYLSLRCAIAAAQRLGRERPEWELAAGRLAHAVAHRPEAFEPKDRFAMDWYYPVLCGALRHGAARNRLREGWARFVVEGLGVRCVDDQVWVTAAETAECVLALDACGMDAEARLLLGWAQHLRHHDGSYWTGRVHPQAVNFPGGERTTYTAAAVVLADQALRGVSPAAGLFRGHGLPRGLDLCACPAPVPTPMAPA